MTDHDQVTYDVVAPSRTDAPPVPYARITLDAPRRRNALSLALLDELRAALDRAAHDDVHTVVLAASGPAFCSGADLTEALADGMTAPARHHGLGQGEQVAQHVGEAARVHGPVRASVKA